MTDRAKKPPDNRWLAVILAIAAACALGYAAFSKQWLYNPRTTGHEEVGFGPLGSSTCIDHGEDAGGKQCMTMTLSEHAALWKRELAEIRENAKRSPGDLQVQAFAAQAAEQLKMSSAFVPFAWITLIACGIAALSLIIAAGLVAGGRHVQWPIMPTTTAILALAVALITGCIFVALKPGPAGYVGVNNGFFAYGGGTIVGIAAALMLNKLLRPRDEEGLAEAMDPEHY